MSWNMKVTSAFPPLPTGILNIIKENRYPKDQNEINAASTDGGLFNNAALSSGFYFNKEQKYCHRPQDGLSNYLTAAIDNTNLHSVLFSGNQPSFGTSTRGLLRDKDANLKDNTNNFKMQFLPDSNTADMRGKFSSTGSLLSNIGSASGVQSYTAFKYKYSSDGTAAPSDKKIDLRYGSISGKVEETVKDNLDDFAGGIDTRLPNRGSEIGGDTFDPDFYSGGGNRGSTPSDDFTQTDPTDPDSSTTPAPTTTAAPTTTPSPTTTTTTSGPITTSPPLTTTTAAPTPRQTVGGPNDTNITTQAPPTCN